MFTPFLTGYFIDCCEPFTDSLSLSILQVSVPFPVSWSSNIWTNKYSLVNFFIMFDWRLCLFVIRLDDAIFHCLPCCLIGLVENRFMLSYSVTDWYLPTLEGVSFREGLGQDQPSAHRFLWSTYGMFSSHWDKTSSTWVWTRLIIERVIFIVSKGNMLHMHICFQRSAYGQT